MSAGRACLEPMVAPTTRVQTPEGTSCLQLQVLDPRHSRQPSNSEENTRGASFEKLLRSLQGILRLDETRHAESTFGSLNQKMERVGTGELVSGPRGPANQN